MMRKMKGVEESLSQAVFLIGAILAAIFLIYMVSQYLSGFSESRDAALSENRQVVLGQIKSAAEECWEANQGRKSAEVCLDSYFNSTDNISSGEILSFMTKSKVPSSSLHAEDIAGPARIIIQYRDNSIYIESR
jgi:hypothetical protein